MTALQFLQNYFNNGDIFYTLLVDRKGDADPKQYKNDTSNLTQLINQLDYYNKNGWDIYYSLNVFNPLNDAIYRQKKYVKEVRTIFFDIDRDAIKIGKTLVDELGDPTYIIRTSPQKFQFLYMLDVPSSDIKVCEEIGEILSNHFKTDKTWDSPRVARLTGMINNKNSYVVNVHKATGNRFELDHFKNYINKHDLKRHSVPDTKKKNIVHNTPIVKSSTNYGDKYHQFLSKHGGDMSRADISFTLWLRKKRNTHSREKIEGYIRQFRPDKLEKHEHELDHYMNNLIENTDNY